MWELIAVGVSAAATWYGGQEAERARDKAARTQALADAKARSQALTLVKDLIVVAGVAAAIVATVSVLTAE